ncbi:hypothetical protein [Leifsonia xyli]|uniref:hypothetical protein n=1 Tax=Leifsonia xyli TaxID=1575 RepID=UPI003D66ABF8
MSRRLPPRLLRRLILSALLGIAVGVAAWYLGMDAEHAIGLGAAALAFTACLSALGEAADVTWPVAPRRRGRDPDGTSCSSAGRSAPGADAPRPRASAACARWRSVPWPCAASTSRTGRPTLSSKSLLGADALSLLRRGSAVAPPRTALVAAVLERLEALDPPTDPEPTPTPEEPPRAR